MHRPFSGRTARTHVVRTPAVFDKSSQAYRLARSIGRAAHINYKRRRTLYGKFLHSKAVKYINKSSRHRVYAVLTLLLVIVSTFVTMVQPYLDNQPYHLSQASRDLLPVPAKKFADLMKHDYKTQAFEYNAGYTGRYGDDKMAGTQGSRINASFKADQTAAMTITDPANEISFTMKPKFNLTPGKQDQNQIFYNLGGVPGTLVYTAQSASVKEDIVLGYYTKNKLSFSYELNLKDGLEARLQKNGSIGV